jgi:hypothetical protein
MKVYLDGCSFSEIQSRKDVWKSEEFVSITPSTVTKEYTKHPEEPDQALDS